MEILENTIMEVFSVLETTKLKEAEIPVFRNNNSHVPINVHRFVDTINGLCNSYMICEKDFNNMLSIATVEFEGARNNV